MIIYNNHLFISIIRVIVKGLLPLLVSHAADHAALSPVLRHPAIIALFRIILWHLAVVLGGPDLVPLSVPLLLLGASFPRRLLAFHVVSIGVRLLVHLPVLRCLRSVLRCTHFRRVLPAVVQE